MLDSSDFWIILTAILCAVACALPGCFLVLRKMSMMGDAISHAVLPGLAVAFLLTGSRASLGMFIGAVIIGILTALFTQWISRFGQVDRGASMGIVFTTLFAIGLILIARAAEKVDLDADCVLYGAIEFVPLDTITLLGANIPRATVIIGVILLINLSLILAFFKEFRLSAFDPNLCDTMGFSSNRMHYLLMTMVSVTTVACFESVGSIIVIAMLIAPPATALLITNRLVPLLIISSLLGTIAAIGGHLSAIYLPELLNVGETNTSGMIAVFSGVCFVIVWIVFLIQKRRNTEEVEASLPN